MIIDEILCEKAVDSSWQMDISYNRRAKIARLTLKSGRSYEIHGMSRREFDKWHNAESQGKYWHKFVAGFYKVTRVA